MGVVMDRTAGRAVRLQQETLMFGAGAVATIPQMAERFRVSKRTIERDLATLEATGMVALACDDAGRWTRDRELPGSGRTEVPNPASPPRAAVPAPVRETRPAARAAPSRQTCARCRRLASLVIEVPGRGRICPSCRAADARERAGPTVPVTPEAFR